MATPVEFHPAAVTEAAEARAWYESRNRQVAIAFLREIDRVVERITGDSVSLPMFLHGTRRCPLRRFPYQIIFRERAHSVQVVAVAHTRRRPGYWARRLTD